MYFIKNPNEPSEGERTLSPIQRLYENKKNIVLPSRLQRDVSNQDGQAGSGGGVMQYYKVAHFQVTIRLQIWKLLMSKHIFPIIPY